MHVSLVAERTRKKKQFEGVASSQGSHPTMGVKILLEEKEKKQTFSGTLSNTSVLTIGETISFFDI
jgi:hypothetical protein